MMGVFKQVFMCQASFEIATSFETNEESATCSFRKSVGYNSANSTRNISEVSSSPKTKKSSPIISQSFSTPKPKSPEPCFSFQQAQHDTTLPLGLSQPFSIMEYLEDIRKKSLKNLCQAFPEKETKKVLSLFKNLSSEIENFSSARAASPLEHFCNGFKLFQELMTDLFCDVYAEFLNKEDQDQLFASFDELENCVLDGFFDESLEEFQILVYFFISEDSEGKQASFKVGMELFAELDPFVKSNKEALELIERAKEELAGFPHCVSVLKKYEALSKVLRKINKAVQAVSEDGTIDPDLAISLLVHCIRASQNHFLLFEMRYMESFLPRHIKETSLSFSMFYVSISFISLEGGSHLEKRGRESERDISLFITRN